MGNRERQRRGCDGKVRHDDRDAAWAAARKTPRTRPYRCRFCGHWHVGHPARRPLVATDALIERLAVAMYADWAARWPGTVEWQRASNLLKDHCRGNARAVINELVAAGVLSGRE